MQKSILVLRFPYGGTFEEGVLVSGGPLGPLNASYCLMVFLFKRQNLAKKNAKIRIGYVCLGCDRAFRRKRDLHDHQGTNWPYCPPVDNSGDTGKR